MKVKKIVPDTSILIQKKLSAMIETGELKNTRIIIPRAVIDELQAQASRGREIGFEGLEEIKNIGFALIAWMKKIAKKELGV